MTVIGGSTASVVAAIRDEVELELERLSKQLIEALAAYQSESPGNAPEAPEQAARLGGARESARVRLAQEDWLDSREFLEIRERWVVEAAAEGMRLLRQKEEAGDGSELLTRLAAEGLAHLPGEVFEVIVSERAAAQINDDWCRSLAASWQKREVRLARPAAGRPEGGCLLRTADGRMTFDNSLAARARRLEAIWRSALAELYG